MVQWIKPAVPRKYIVLACCMAVIGLLGVQSGATKVEHPLYEKQVLAAQIMMESLEVLQEARQQRGISIDREYDPNETGLIGGEFTIITTSVGSLEAKRTSTSPAFAALLVRLFQEAGLQAGDSAAIGASGSFPGLIIATLAACRALDLKPLLFYSVGSSMYGANIPEFTFIVMLEILREHNLLPYEILAVSLGSDNDRGEGMFFASAQETMFEIAAAGNAPLIFADNNAESIQQRQAMYLEYNDGRLPDIFVNIGGASPNSGNTNASLHLPNGLLTEVPVKSESPERGLVLEYLEQGVPVIHLLNIKDLALKSGIAVDPVPFLPVGTEEVYFITAYNKWLIWSSIVGALGILVFVKRRVVGQRS